MGSDVTPAILTKAQARRLTDKVVESAEQTWSLVLEAHDRKAWKALGYDSFNAYCGAEFGMTDRNARHLLTQGRVVHALEQASGRALPPATVSANAARVLKSDLPALTEKVAEAVKDVPKAKRPEIVKGIIDEHRKAKQLPGPSPVEPKPELQRPGQALTKEQVRTQLAAIRTLGPDVIAHSVDPDDIKATYNVLADAYRAARPKPQPVLPQTTTLARPTVMPNFKKG